MRVLHVNFYKILIRAEKKDIPFEYLWLKRGGVFSYAGCRVAALGRERQHCIEGIVRVLEVGGETTLGDLDDTPVPPPPPPPHMSSAY